MAQDAGEVGGSTEALDEAVSYLLALARERAQRLRHPQPSFLHLLLVFLERHLPMAQDLAPEIAWQTYRGQLEAQLAKAAAQDDTP
jgi:hypothetical protein